MEETSDTAQDAFLATEVARLAFLTAVRRMTRGDHPLDVEHLIRLADQLCEVHHQSMLRPRRPGKSLPTEH